MPTYDYKCRECGATARTFQSIGEYTRNPIVPPCPADVQHTMERMLCVVPAMSGLANALAGDRHYEGLRAPDGTDISSRSKHREYMRRTGLTTVDDFGSEWRKAKEQREAFFQAKHQDKELRQDLTQQVMKAVSE